MVGPEGYGEDVIHDIRTDRRSAERGGADRTVVHRPVARCLAVVGVTVLALVATACASSSSSGSTTSSTGVVARSVVGRRYCEVLLVHLGPSGVYADVYNSYPLMTLSYKLSSNLLFAGMRVTYKAIEDATDHVVDVTVTFSTQ